MDTPATFRYLFYPPAGHSYFEFRQRAPFQPLAPGFTRVNAAWAAELAMLAYAQDGETAMQWEGVASRLSAAGFASAQPIGDWAGPGTQAFLATHLEFAVLAFRGTEPADWSDVLLDLGVLPSGEQWDSGLPGRGTWRGLAAALTHGTLIHAGFQRALNTVWPQIESCLPPSLPILVCGHSLGGALAMLAVSRFTGRANPIQLYTFGGPRVGNDVLGARILSLTQGRVFRVVDEDDFVAAIPPAVLGYVHSPATQFRLQPNGDVGPDNADLEVNIVDVAGALESVVHLLAERGSLDTPVPQARLVAHSPGRYVARLTVGL
jgi:hypothetical protein